MLMLKDNITEASFKSPLIDFSASQNWKSMAVWTSSENTSKTLASVSNIQQKC